MPRLPRSSSRFTRGAKMRRGDLLGSALAQRFGLVYVDFERGSPATAMPAITACVRGY